MGNPNSSGMGPSPQSGNRESRPLTQSQGSLRGPSGPLSAGGARSGSPYTAGDSGRRSGGLSGRTSGNLDDGQWQGQGSNRSSRNLTPPGGRPALNGRGQSGQWSNNQRGWDADEEEWDSRPSRAPSGRQPTGGRAALNGRTQQPMRKGTAQRGDWVVETDPKYKAPGSGLRVRLLFLLLAAVIALGAGIYFVPGAKSRILSFLPGSSNPNGATSGNLTLQVNAPSAKVTLDGKDYTTNASQTPPFSSIAVSGLTPGNHTIAIRADKYTDFSGQLPMPDGDTTMTAWLAPSAAQLTALAAQFKPAAAPDPGAAGDSYTATKTATGALTITIKYTLAGLNDKSYASTLAQGGDTQTPAFQPATLTVTPDIVFTNAAGTQLYEYKPNALPAAKFSVQMPLAIDNKGAFQFGTPTVTLPSNVKVSFTGPAKNDLALYYAIASVLPDGADPLNFVCIGAVDNKNFNPEDGLLIVETKDDATHAHYFYRWGMLWATNDIARNLTPNALVAQSGSNEFEGANTARTNASCGS